MRAKTAELLPIKTGGKHPWKIKDIQLNKDQVTRENKLVKAAGVNVTLSQEHEIEKIKCSLDPIYFCRKYVRIMTLDHGIMPFELYDYQERMIREYATNLYNVTLTSRQMGKCCFYTTLLKVRNKKTGEIKTVTIGDFYKSQKNKISNQTK